MQVKRDNWPGGHFNVAGLRTTRDGGWEANHGGPPRRANPLGSAASGDCLPDWD